MPRTILPYSPEVGELTTRQRDVLADMFQAMPLTEAGSLMRLKPAVLRGAIERGELQFIQFPGHTRKLVTPSMLAEWIEGHCVKRNPVLEGDEAL